MSLPLPLCVRVCREQVKPVLIEVFVESLDPPVHDCGQSLAAQRLRLLLHTLSVLYSSTSRLALLNMRPRIPLAVVEVEMQQDPVRPTEDNLRALYHDVSGSQYHERIQLT